MPLLFENVLDRYNQKGNPCFSVTNDISFEDVTINSKCHKAIIKRIFDAFNELDISPECIQTVAVVGSVLTPLSTDKSTIDVAIILDNDRFYDEVRRGLYSNKILDNIIRSRSDLLGLDFSRPPDSRAIKSLIYLVRPYLLKDCNNLKVSEDINMRVYFIVEPDGTFLNKRNYYKIVERGKPIAQYIKNIDVGYIDFLKEINKKQHYKYIVKPLFLMFKDYKIILKDLIEHGKIKNEHKDNLERLKSAVISLKENRFKSTETLLWRDKNNKVIEIGYNKKSLDYFGAYSYFNVLYHHLSPELVAPQGAEFTFRNLFDIIENEGKNQDNIVEFAKKCLEMFGSFKPDSFLSKKLSGFL